LGYRHLAVAAAAASLLTGPVSAQAGDDIVDKIINAPAPESFSVYGLKQPPKVRKDPTVPQDGMKKALRIAIPGKGANPWDISLSDPVLKPIKAGDQLDLVFWARLESGENGATSAVLPNNSVQLAKEPYTGFMGGAVTITPEWKLHEVKGRADRDYAAGEVNISMHLATAKQVIDIGPIILLNLGQ